MNTKENLTFYNYLIIGIIISSIFETINKIEKNTAGIGLIIYLLMICLYFLIQINKKQKTDFFEGD